MDFPNSILTAIIFQGSTLFSYILSSSFACSRIIGWFTSIEKFCKNINLMKSHFGFNASRFMSYSSIYRYKSNGNGDYTNKLSYSSHRSHIRFGSEESPQHNFLLIIFGIPQLYFNSFYDLLYSKGHRYFLITILHLLYVQE